MIARKSILRTVIAASLFLFAGGGTVLWQLHSWWNYALSLPFKGYVEPEVLFEIPRGQGVSQVAARLEERGLILSAALFRAALWNRREPVTLKAGTYRFEQPLKLEEVIDKLARGDVAYRRVTIPEGYDLAQIMAAMVDSGLGTVAGFAEVMTRVEWIRDLDPDAPDLEGYLMPDTYHLPLDADEEALVRRMVTAFRDFWTAERQARARELGLTTREAVTLASLVEKETAVPAERELVSGVFHNRLRLGMRLGCDPTVIYAVRRVKEYDGIIHRSDLQLDSPYNTYIYPGLPPGPIANPGRAALDAALDPAETDYLFFVSRNDGTHLFSRTYDRHRQAVEQFQR